MAEITEAMDQAVKAITVKTGKYLTFFFEEEEYGIGTYAKHEDINIYKKY